MLNEKDFWLWDEILSTFRSVGEGDLKSGDGRLSMTQIHAIWNDKVSYYRVRKVVRAMEKEGILSRSSHRFKVVKNG